MFILSVVRPYQMTMNLPFCIRMPFSPHKRRRKKMSVHFHSSFPPVISIIIIPAINTCRPLRKRVFSGRYFWQSELDSGYLVTKWHSFLLFFIFIFFNLAGSRGENSLLQLCPVNFDLLWRHPVSQRIFSFFFPSDFWLFVEVASHFFLGWRGVPRSSDAVETLQLGLGLSLSLILPSRRKKEGGEGRIESRKACWNWRTFCSPRRP